MEAPLNGHHASPLGSHLVLDGGLIFTILTDSPLPSTTTKSKLVQVIGSPYQPPNPQPPSMFFTQTFKCAACVFNHYDSNKVLEHAKSDDHVTVVSFGPKKQLHVIRVIQLLHCCLPGCSAIVSYSLDERDGEILKDPVHERVCLNLMVEHLKKHITGRLECPNHECTAEFDDVDQAIRHCFGCRFRPRSTQSPHLPCNQQITPAGHHHQISGFDRTCSVCNKRFSNAFNFKTHMRFHERDRPFKCDDCEMCFHTISNLNRHKKRYCYSIGAKKKPNSSSYPDLFANEHSYTNQEKISFDHHHHHHLQQQQTQQQQQPSIPAQMVVQPTDYQTSCEVSNHHHHHHHHPEIYPNMSVGFSGKVMNGNQISRGYMSDIEGQCHAASMSVADPQMDMYYGGTGSGPRNTIYDSNFDLDWLNIESSDKQPIRRRLNYNPSRDMETMSEHVNGVLPAAPVNNFRFECMPPIPSEHQSALLKGSSKPKLRAKTAKKRKVSYSCVLDNYKPIAETEPKQSLSDFEADLYSNMGHTQDSSINNDLLNDVLNDHFDLN